MKLFPGATRFQRWTMGATFLIVATYAISQNKQSLVDVSKTRLSSPRSEEHTSELQSLMRTSYAVFGLKNKQCQGSYPNITIQNRLKLQTDTITPNATLCSNE